MPELKEYLPELKETTRVRTRRGYHYYFSLNGEYVKSTNNLFGSDEVVCAYNNLMKHSYDVEVTGNKDPKEMMSLWGTLLLEIRKSLGNKDTKLNKFDMLRAMVKDIDRLESK